jgi:hypothetical protein
MTTHNIIKNIKVALNRLGDTLRVAPKKFLDKGKSGLMIDNDSKKQQQNSEKTTIDSSTYIRQHTTQRD